MNMKQLKQYITQRGLSTDGLKPALAERLEQRYSKKYQRKRYQSQTMPSTQSTGGGWSPSSRSDGERGVAPRGEARHGQDRARGRQDSSLQRPEGAQGARAPALLLAQAPDLGDAVDGFSSERKLASALLA